MHTEEWPYYCDVCNVSFHNLSTLKEHMFSHNSDCPFPCYLCGKGFTCQSGLTKHNCVHTGWPPYIHEVCSQSFHDKCTVIVHQVTHSKEHPFKYDACNRSFGCRKQLSSHISLSVWNVCSGVVCVSDQDCLAKFLKWNWDKVTQITYCWTRQQLSLVSLSVIGMQLGNLTLELQTIKTVCWMSVLRVQVSDWGDLLIEANRTGLRWLHN
jgi:hypothetical protein